MNAGLFDMFHDRPDQDIGAVGHRIHVQFDRIFKELVELGLAIGLKNATYREILSNTALR